MTRHAYSALLALCIAVSVLPILSVRHLPAVDAPEHIFLINVLRTVSDPGSFYSETYVARPGLTYLTFYYTARALSAAVGVEWALKLWLALVLGAIPLSILALCRALGRSKWLALLACPLIYTDNFYWGLVSFVSSLALTFFTLAFFIRSLEDPLEKKRSAVLLALSLLGLQLTHGAGMIFPAVALPLLVLTTPSDFKRRLRTLVAILPGVLVFLAWLFSGVGKNRQLGAPGEHWKAYAPLFDKTNFVWHAPREKVPKLVELLSNGFWDYADRPFIYLLGAAAALVVVLAILRPQGSEKPAVAQLRPALLFGLGLAYFFFLPSDINGYMYQIYPRYSQVAALLAIPVLPFPRGPLYKVFVAAAVAVALYAGLNLTVLFHRFDEEAETFEMVAKQLTPHAKVMHLVTDTGSRYASHAVYLHYAALAAYRVEGIPSFSLAVDPSFPVGYREGRKPPAPEWEWRPQLFSWEQARWYDYYLVRGEPPEALFREHLGDVELVGQADRWRLLKRRVASPH